MAHGLNSVLKRGVSTVQGCKTEGKTGIGSRRIFPPHFKLQVLDSYRNDADCKGNQRATARKYGIHRRQIQKWLQVENNLRNSVSKTGSCGAKGSITTTTTPNGNMVDCNNGGEIPEGNRKFGIEMALSNGGQCSRQRDDMSCGADMYTLQAAVSGVLDARVPSVSPVYSKIDPSSGHPWPPECSSGRGEGGCCRVPPAPLDFSTHSRRGSGYGSPIVASPPCCVSPVPPDSATPMDLSFKRPTSSSAPVPLMPFSPLASPPLPMPQQQQHRVLSPPSLAQPHPDVWDLSAKSHGLKRKCDEERSTLTSQKPVKLFKPYLDDIKPSKPELNPIKLESLSPPCCTLAIAHPPSNSDNYYYTNNNNNICEIKSEYASTYTLHELQPKTALNFYYPYTSQLYHPDYESNSFNAVYEDSSLHGVPLKQRQSYSLDFKLQAIDCYYEDDQCKGNQRAVASKYNIHRRQIQKWLKQAEELRQRNESIKQMHAVR
ncbi:unnamed protein product [Brassicogethes aeneus]|uniref:Brinker DNA-binding domain-containing protein n=1 Tax=Brassicogethes aeneus TaxID=1431903 RepID=A0A9P0B3T2_BRAAE|nr:unnamed protein product [Brassicogethes aeneus]